MPKTPIVPGDRQTIASYYKETWFDYRVIWLNASNRAIHFGYFDDSTRSHSDSLLNMNRVLAAGIDPKPGWRILDCGCGVGGTAMWFAESYDVEVTGVTITPDQVERAYRYADERGLSGRVHFGLQDYTRMALPDETFDAVYGLEAICYAMDKRDFIAEAYRVLKPGGRLVVQDGFRSPRPLNLEEEKLQESWLSGWIVPNLATLDEFATWSKEAGFVDVEQEDCTDKVRRSCRRLYMVTMAAYPTAVALHKLGLRTELQQGNVRAARDQYRALQRGLWGYGIVRANKP
ncbi:MAG: SAM-dependent methyltransferase [Actinomycetota bacterium]